MILAIPSNITVAAACDSGPLPGYSNFPPRDFGTRANLWNRMEGLGLLIMNCQTHTQRVTQPHGSNVGNVVAKDTQLHIFGSPSSMLGVCSQQPLQSAPYLVLGYTL